MFVFCPHQNAYVINTNQNSKMKDTKINTKFTTLRTRRTFCLYNVFSLSSNDNTLITLSVEWFLFIGLNWMTRMTIHIHIHIMLWFRCVNMNLSEGNDLFLGCRWRLETSRKEIKLFRLQPNMHTFLFSLRYTFVCCALFNWPLWMSERKNVENAARNPWRWSRSVSANLVNPHVVQISLLIVSHNFQHFHVVTLKWKKQLVQLLNHTQITYLQDQDCLLFDTLFPLVFSLLFFILCCSKFLLIFSPF